MTHLLHRAPAPSEPTVTRVAADRATVDRAGVDRVGAGALPDAAVDAAAILGDLEAGPLAQVEAMRRELAALREQLTETQRLATIGTIAAVIAHEFNNLLTPIVSYSQFALTSAEGDKPDLPLIRKALGKAYQSSTKAGKICASMLALARGESSFGPVPVQGLVDEALSVLARDPQKDGIALRVSVEPGLTAVGDPVQLEQVLLNLLINARQALLGAGGHGRAAGGGTITVRATAVEAADDEAADDAGAGAAGDVRELRVQVSDNGPGIPERLLAKIFQPFFTTKGTAKKGEPKGTGLGLAICREIVEHHKGRIAVESAVGKGTTFTLHLPMA